MKIYVASSWRNIEQPTVVDQLRKWGHEVYDFRHPTHNNNGFHWSEIDPEWRNWMPDQFIAGLESDIAGAGFLLDMQALIDSDAVVLVMPCGKSSHLELGWAVGAGKTTAILLNGKCEPELMYKLADLVTTNLTQVNNYLMKIVQP